MPAPDTETPLYFRLLNEIGIINQLSTRLFEDHLPDGFLITHFSVLNHLVRLGDGSTPLELARAFQVPKTTMTHTLAGLDQAGLIRFVPNLRDGRSKRVMLTEAGRRFRDAAIAGMAPDIAKLASVIPPARVEAMLPLLEELRAYLDRDRDG